MLSFTANGTPQSGWLTGSKGGRAAASASASASGRWVMKIAGSAAAAIRR
jgi:hypothetical protein